MTKVLKDKLYVNEKEIPQSSSVIIKMMSNSQKINEIINITKSFSDKHGIVIDEGVSTSTMATPKFVKVTTQKPNMKSVVVTPKCKSIVTFQPISTRKVNTSLKASSFR